MFDFFASCTLVVCENYITTNVNVPPNHNVHLSELIIRIKYLKINNLNSLTN